VNVDISYKQQTSNPADSNENTELEAVEKDGKRITIQLSFSLPSTNIAP